ncbi:16517_t:CDS:2 [Funneliformis geosporum]|uniref:6396_t:CDS:1 n=1 Tax=Funneliformis geosporum TaxID=1117311 RepID=A0A9W4SGF2_9GLOM|nr:6396_t:CDS:2 [Funneliformis geosporum]CAI2169451.1 16517_t:CDS:2 [Funneliformis geosporum]
MKKIISYLLISVLICSQSKAQQPPSHPSTLDPALKDQWCKSTIETCSAICKNRKTVPAANSCFSLNLLENCLCTDGYAPTLSNYENTVSYFLCEYNRPAGPCSNTCYLGTEDCLKNNESPPLPPPDETPIPIPTPPDAESDVKSPPPTDKNSTNKKSIAIAIGTSASLLSAIIAVSLIIWVRRRRKISRSKPPNYFIPAPKRKISSLSDGPSVGRSLTSIKAGLVKDSNASIGTNSSSGSIMQTGEKENNDGTGIVITKTHSVSVHQDDDYFGSTSFTHLSATNSIASVDYYNRFGSVENLTTDASSMSNKPGNNRSSGCEGGYLAGNSNQNTSNDEPYAFI